jgi:hypothetical protein
VTVVNVVSPAISDPKEAQREQARAINRVIAKLQPFGVRTMAASDAVSLSFGLYDCDATAGAVTLTVGAAGGYTGRQFVAVKADASGNAVVVTDGGSFSHSLTTQGQTLSFASTGSRWVVL